MNLKYQLVFTDRIGIVFDIAGMITRKGMSFVNVEVEEVKGVANVYIEINLENQPLKKNKLADWFRGLEGVREVKEIKNLPQEKREEKFRILIEGISDGIISVDDTGIVSTINRVACSILELRPEAVIGNDIREVLPGDNVLLECLAKKIPVRQRKSEVTSRGKVEFFASAKPVTGTDGRFFGAVLIMKDLKEVRDMVEAVKNPIQVTFDDIIGNSPALENLKLLAVKIAKTDSIVAIRGQSGTGKELLARAIHFESGRTGPFLPVNCAAMPETLLESELFGYVPGAFTGARKKGKKGLFELAENGTLFLDEIGDMPKGPQAKILRVLQEGTVRRIGGSEEIPIHARVITATNRNLEKRVKEKKFREDLYYRICVLPIHIPSLKERYNDIENLVYHFLHDLNSRLGKQHQSLTKEALNKLMNHSWPGNVRELKNVIERASIISDSEKITPSSILFSHEIGESQQIEMNTPVLTKKGGNLKDLVAEYEKDIIKQVLNRETSIRQSAKQLGISHTALLNKIKKHRIPVK